MLNNHIFTTYILFLYVQKVKLYFWEGITYNNNSQTK